jgi:hypothetical protein
MHLSTIKSAFISLSFSLFLLAALPFVLQAEDVRPDFSGTWKAISITTGAVPDKSVAEIKQTDSTFAIRTLVENGIRPGWSVYPTDGTVTKRGHGQRADTKTGHWEGKTLVLESTGPGNAPWRRSTTQELISLTEDGRVLKIRVHLPSDPSKDYEVSHERLNR